MSGISFPYLNRQASSDPRDFKPWLPFTLQNHSQCVDLIGLVDSGANMSVLPHSVGVSLGANWQQLSYPMPIRLPSGMVNGKLLKATAIIAGLPPIDLVFTWVLTDDVPIILGQIDFFVKFDVLFSRSRLFFELTLRP